MTKSHSIILALCGDKYKVHFGEDGPGGGVWFTGYKHGSIDMWMDNIYIWMSANYLDQKYGPVIAEDIGGIYDQTHFRDTEEMGEWIFRISLSDPNLEESMRNILERLLSYE